MDTQVIAEVPETVTLPEIVGPTAGPEVRAETPALLETKLPDDWHKAYSLRLQGMPVGEIAQKCGVERTTIWRWAKAVENEFIQYLEQTPQFNIVSEQFKRLRDLEETNRQAATAAKSERAKSMFLSNAQKAIAEQNKLLLDTGVFERVPDKLFKIVATVKPVDVAEQERAHSGRSREDLISDLLERLSRTHQL